MSAIGLRIASGCGNQTHAHPSTAMSVEPFPCWLDVPEALMPRARFALRMLLLPIGLEPRWCHESVGSAIGLYYGPGETRVPDNWIRLASAEGGLEAEKVGLPDVSYASWDGRRWPILFQLSNQAVPNFDIVSAAFFWLAGAQEYIVQERDRHGRFPFARSIQAGDSASNVPAVDGYRRLLADALRERGLALRSPQWNGRDWALCVTHDVDYLRKYRPGILYRELVQYALQNRNALEGRARFQRLWNAIRQAASGDPFRKALHTMFRRVEEAGGTATYLFKAGGHEPYDVPTRLESRFARKFFATLEAEGFDIGLHPSYFASVHPSYLRSQKARLTRAAGRDVHISRQHYLRFSNEVTPWMLEAENLSVDSSLAFAENVGFRRATSMPFQLYDLTSDVVTNVWEIPLHVMDSTLFGYQKLDAERAVEQTREVIDAVRQVGGVCVCLWHNVLGDELDFPGWLLHFEDTLEYARRHGGAILSLRDAFAAWQAFCVGDA